MTAATLAPDAIGADLLTELRELLDACEVASTTEQVRKLCDKAAKVIGRARRRVTKYEQQTIEQAAPERQAAPPAAAVERPQAAIPAATPASAAGAERAEVRIPPGEPPPDRQPPPEPPPEAPLLPPKGPRSWAAWANAWLLAFVVAFIVGVRGICSRVARGVRWVTRRVVRFAAARRVVRRSP